MDSLETKQLLGYTIEIFDIQEFKDYYDEHTNSFSDFSRSAFLKAISIPPSYFMEQPEETQEELLCNKLALTKIQKKYAGMSIIVVSIDGDILNATKIKTEEVEARYEAVASIEDVEGIVWNRPLVRDGYICGYLVCGTVSREGYNNAIFVDFPLLFNKPTIVHEGYVKLANSKMPIEKDYIYYNSTDEVDYDNFQHIALAIADKVKNSMFDPSIDDDLNETSDSFIYKEPLEIVCNLVEQKVLPKTLLFPMVKFLSKQVDDGMLLNVRNLLESVIVFDTNVKALKQINAIRSCKDAVEKLCEEEKESEVLEIT